MSDIMIPKAVMELINQSASPKLWTLDPAAPVIAIDPRRLAAFDAVGVRKPKLRRLLLAIWYLAVKRVVTGKPQLTTHALASLVWPGKIPQNWRNELARLLNAAVAAKELAGFQLGTDGTVKLTHAKGFFGTMSSLLWVRDGGKTNWAPSLVLKYTKPSESDKAIIDKVIESGACDVPCEDDAHKIDAAATRRYASECVAAVCSANDGRSSIASLRAAGKITWVFAPSMLGEPLGDPCIAKVVNTLVNERTVGTSKFARIKDAKTANYSGRSKNGAWICPILDKDTVYTVFGGNGYRRGCGYSLARWANLHGTDARTFLADLRATADALGLIVAGVDRTGKWYDLQALQEVPGKNDVAVRIYTADTWAARWATLFAWRGEQPKPHDPNAELDDRGPEEQQLLRSRVEATGGVRKVAAAMAADPSLVSKVLRGKRKSPALVAKIRSHVDAHLVLGGGEVAEIMMGTLEENGWSNMAWALAYRRALGWSVIPIRPHDHSEPKRRHWPYIQWKPFMTFVPTERQVKEWWVEWPDAEIALVLGPVSGVFCVDSDAAAATHMLFGHLGGEPVAPKVYSGSWDTSDPLAKRHYYFRYPMELGTGTLSHFMPWHPALELRGHRGLLKLPPTCSAKAGDKFGRPYRWAFDEGRAIWQASLPPVPDAILTVLKQRLEPRGMATRTLGRRVSWQGRHLAEDTVAFLDGLYASDRGWNDRLFGAAADLFGNGVSFEDGQAALLAGAAPRPECIDAAVATIKSAWGNVTRKHPLRLAQ